MSKPKEKTNPFFHGIKEGEKTKLREGRNLQCVKETELLKGENLVPR